MPKHKKKGPLSLQGATVTKQALSRSNGSVSLRVQHRDSAATGRGLPAYVAPSTAAQLFQPDDEQPQQQQQPDPGMFFLQLSSGSDCVLHTRVSADVPDGFIQLDEVQQANLRLCPGEPYKFSVFEPSSAAAGVGAAEAEDGEASGSEDSSEEDEQAQPPFELTDMDVEVRLLPTGSSNSSSSSIVEVDARVLTRAFCKQCFGRVLAVNEYVVVDLPGTPPLLLRVTATNSLTADEQQEALCYHCFRGMLTPDTQVYISAAAAAASAQDHQQLQQPQSHSTCQATQQLSQLTINGNQQQQQPAASVPSRIGAGGAGSLQLLHAVSRAAARPPTNVVHVFTSDGEWFPVKKKLLRPCIALTKAVRDSGDSVPEVTVPIDTCTFDRVLLFLEAAALGRPPPGFGIHLLDDLQQAGEHLGLRSLQAHCQELKGSRQAALGLYSFADVQRANASGKVWLLLDGMVLDVTRWLPEHPGGSTIIPAQATDCDCSRFFEMYHASRESFLYLQEFYIGELLASDLPHVPLGGRHAPSADFMMQLQEFTDSLGRR